MYKVMYREDVRYVSNRDGVYYYTRRVPYDVRQHYASHRLSFSFKTKSYANAVRAAHSVTQRLEDYWLGLQLQQMDIPAIHLVKTDDVIHTSPVMMDAVDMYLSIKSNNDRIFVRTARRNGEYVSKVLGNRPITSHSPYLFPRYCNGITTNSNSASAALNKWLKQVAGSDYVIHSFRHSMRDRLRAVNCPSDMIDQIGGWSKKSIGEGYGQGFQLKQILQMMKLLIN